MNVSLGQILIVILVGLLLFSNFPNILRDLIRGLNSIKNNILKKDNESIKKVIKQKQEKRDSNP